MYEFPKLELVIHYETMVKAIKTNPPDFLLSKKSLYNLVAIIFVVLNAVIRQVYYLSNKIKFN